MNKPFSTGSSELDGYLGGVNPGDTILIIQSALRDARPLLKAFSNHLRTQDQTLHYLNLNDSWTPMLTGVRVRSVSPETAGTRKTTGLSRWATARIREISAGDAVILDDLTEWSRRLGSGSRLSSLIQLLSKVVARKKAFLYLTAMRTGIGNPLLSEIKDIASISLELSIQEGDIFLHALHTRGRLPGVTTSPFGFRLTRRTGRPGKHLSAMPDFHEGPGNKLKARHEEREMISDLLLHGALQFSGTGVAVVDITGTFRVVNELLAKKLDIGETDLSSLDITTLVPPDGRRDFLKFIARAKLEDAAMAELVLQSVAGKRQPVLVRSNRIGSGLTVFFIDDNRKGEADSRAARARELEHALLFDNAPYALCVADTKRIYRVNASFMKMRGEQADQVQDPPNLRECFDTKFLRKLRQAMTELGPSDEPVLIEGAVLRVGGAPLPVRVTISTAGLDGRGRYHLLVENISSYVGRIAQLESGDRQFRAISEQITWAVGLLRENTFIYVNSVLAGLLGFKTPGAALGISLLECFPETERDRLAGGITGILGPKRDTWVTETSARKTDGELVAVKLSFRRLHGLPEAETLVEFEDVSARRSEEAKLSGMRKGADQIRDILQASTATLDLDKLLQVSLDKSMELLGWSGGLVYTLDPATQVFTQVLHKKVPRKLLTGITEFPADEGLGGYVIKTLESHVLNIDAYPSYLPLGTLFRQHGIKRISLVPLVHGDSPLGFIMGLTDSKGKDYPAETLTILGRQLGNAIANARKLTAVKESEGKLHRAVDSLSGIVYTSGPDGIIRSIDQGVSTLLGYTRNDFGRNKSLYLSLIHDEDKKAYLERVTESETLPSTFVRAYRMRPKAKAAYVWVRDSVSVMRDNHGHVTGFTGLLSDVTGDREKFREVELEHSVLRSVQDVIPDGIAAFNAEGLCVEWNPTMERITGRGRMESIGRLVGEIASLPDGVSAEEIFGKSRERKLLALGLTADVSDDRKRYEVALVPVPGYRGDPPGFLLRYADVTEREKEIHDLLESEKVLLNVIDAMDDVMMITDLGGKIVEINQAFLSRTGYSRNEVVGQDFPYRWLDEKDMGRFLDWISRIREQRWPHDFDLTWITSGGSKIQMSLNTTPIRNSYGEPVAMLNIARDITERVRFTDDLESRNIQIEMINRIITLANRSNDFAEVFTTVAREVVGVIPSQSVFLLLTGDLDSTFSRIENFGPSHLESGEFLPVAESLLAPGAGGTHVIGDLLYEARVPVTQTLVEIVRSAVVIPLVLGGERVGVFGVANREAYSYTEEDAALLVPLVQQIGGIIERTKLFRQIASDSTYVRNLLDSIDSPVYTVDNSHTITQINRAGISFLREFGGVGGSALKGVKLFSILADTPLRKTLRTGMEQGEYSAEISVDSGAGERIIRVMVNSLRDDGGTTGYVFSHADITNLKKTETELRDRAQQLITLHEISTLVGNSYDMNVVLRSALPLLKSAIGADAVIVYLPRQESGELVLEHQEGFPPEDIDDIRILSPGRSITGDVMKRQEAHYIEQHAEQDDRISPTNRIFLEKQGMQAMGIIPILVKDKVLGALDILYRDTHLFLEGERHILSLVGNQIGAAIENAQLYRELTAQVDRLSILFELSRSFASLLDTAQICRAVFDHVRRVSDCKRFTISLLDANTGNLTPKLSAERVEDQYRIIDGIEPESVAVSEVLAGRKTHVSSDGRLVLIPMLSEESITGVIEVTTGGDVLDEVQLRLLESIGSLTAIALEKGKLFEETVAKSDEIEQRNRELDDFTYVVSHDLKEPLISIEGFSRILQLDYRDVIREEGKEYLDSLVGATTRMKGLIDDLLLLSRVGRTSESFSSLDVFQIVGEIRTDMEFHLNKRNVLLSVSPGRPKIKGNETQLKILFRNLIANAVKFNDKLRPEVEIGFRIHENNSYLFWVKDNGIGIEPEFFGKIFIIFQRLHRREEFEGSGAGLAIVKKIIETHQGKIWVESEMGAGSTFYFILPSEAQA